MNSPDAQSVAVYDDYTCPATKAVKDDPTIPIVTCDARARSTCSRRP